MENIIILLFEHLQLLLILSIENLYGLLTWTVPKIINVILETSQFSTWVNPINVSIKIPIDSSKSVS